jgi:chromosome segregation ATPase
MVEKTPYVNTNLYLSSKFFFLFSRIEKDKHQILTEISDVRSATEEVARSKASAEKSSKNLITQLNDINKKVEEAALHLGDFEAAKHKLASENGDLLRQLQELDNVASMAAKARDSLHAGLEEQKHNCDSEAKERSALLSKYRNLEHEYDGQKEHYDEECLNRDNAERQLAKAQAELDMWRRRYEIDGLQKAEELEMSRLKLQARLSEAQNTIEQLNNKAVQLDKSKNKLQEDLNELAIMLDQAQVMHAAMEKRAKQFDR